MSWNCPHLSENECNRLKKKCQPLQNGCVLEGKVQFVDNTLVNTCKTDLYNNGGKDGKKE